MWHPPPGPLDKDTANDVVDYAHGANQDAEQMLPNQLNQCKHIHVLKAIIRKS